MKDLNVMTSFEDFIKSCDLHDAEMLNMCDAIFTGQPQPLFHFVPAKNVFDGLILVFEPLNIGLLLSKKAYNYFIPWIEKEKFHKEPYDAYLNWKMAVEKED